MKKDKFDFSTLAEAKQTAEANEQTAAKMDELTVLSDKLDTIISLLSKLHDTLDMELIRAFIDGIATLPKCTEDLNEATQIKVTDSTRQNYHNLVKTTFNNAFKDLKADMGKVTEEYKKDIRDFTSSQLKRLNEKKGCTTISTSTFWCFIALFTGLLSSFGIIFFLNAASWDISPIYKAQLWPIGISLMIVATIHIAYRYVSKH